jgi:outer membrane protein TolC
MPVLNLTIPRLTAIGCLLSLLGGFSGVSHALDLSLSDPLHPIKDPFKTSQDLPKINKPWVSHEKLPTIGEVPSPIIPKTPMNLAQLTELALINNPKSRAQWAQVSIDAAALGLAKSAYLPSLTLTTSLVQTQPISTSGATNLKQNRYGPSLTLNYVLFDFGKRSSEVSAAGYRLMASELNRNRVLQDVVLEVERAYYQMQGISALVSAVQQTLDSATTSVQAAEARRSAGLATIGDVYRARTAETQEKLKLQRSQGELAKVKGRLANAIGVPVNQAIQIEPWSKVQENSELTNSVEQFLQETKETRPDLKAAEAQVLAARANVGALEAQGLPTLEVVGNSTWTYFLENRPESMGYNVGLQVRVPLFTGFQNTYAIRQGKAQVEQTEANRDQTYR